MTYSFTHPEYLLINDTTLIIMRHLTFLLCLSSSLLLTSCSKPSDDHHHVHTPHLGVMAPFNVGTEQLGFVELKLHDDKGDLELWLSHDVEGGQPFDLPLDTVITVTFPELEEKVISLQVRNPVTNEDEDGEPTIRDAGTNYFIFPGETGADAQFLQGADMETDVIVTFQVDGSDVSTPRFTLRPHIH